MLEMTGDLLDPAVERFVAHLRSTKYRVVFAESCTAGLIASTLGRTPGISDYLCGSTVVYREATKTAWLDVSSADLANPAITAVSPQVAEAMALSVLSKTPEADYSASITGYLGPDSAPGMDGVAFVGVAARDQARTPFMVLTREIRFNQRGGRIIRQHDAAAMVLDILTDVFSQRPKSGP